MFGISAPCAHDWENEYKAINDMEVANLHNQIESEVASTDKIQATERKPTPDTSCRESKPTLSASCRENTPQSITAGEIARRINSVTRAQTRGTTIEEDDEEDERALLARVAAIRIARQQAAKKNATSKPKQTENPDNPSQCTHADSKTLTMSSADPTVKVSDLMSVSKIQPSD